MLAYQLDYNEKVIAEGLSFNTEAAEYLDKEFKGCVTTSLEELLRERPENPIPFLAKRIRENKREEVLLAEKLIREQKATEMIARNPLRRRRPSNTITTSSYGSCTADKMPSEEEPAEESGNSRVMQTPDGYRLKFDGDLECNVSNSKFIPPRYIPGVNIGKVISPSLYDLDAVFRVMEASAVPNEDSGKPTPMAIIVEQSKAPEQIVFNKGIPYRFDLVGPLQKEIRKGNKEVPRPSQDQKVEDVALQLLKSQWSEDIVPLEDAMKDFVNEKNNSGSDIHLLLLPSVQSNYMETYESIDSVFFEIMHPDLTSCMRRGKHYSKIPSTREMPYLEPPNVLFVSYSPHTACLTFSRVLETFFPYYERLQNIKMDKLREMNKSKINELNLSFCEKYWAEVQLRRESRDIQRKTGEKTNKAPREPSKLSPAAVKQARSTRREKEDTRFLAVSSNLKNAYATRIQKLFRGYSTRRKEKPLIVPRVTTQTLFDSPMSLAVPPLLRLCATRISKIHGELFGNYRPSLLPEPQRVKVYKPIRNVVGDGEDESETEDWVEQTIYIPPKRFSMQPLHMNPFQRLLEYHRLAECSVLETAMKIQKQCGGLSLLQRKAYDYMKSLTLSLLHIAYLELFHRDRLPFDAMCFSSFMRTFHGEVCGWLSYPHIISQSCLLSICRSPFTCNDLFEVSTKKIQVIRNFSAITLRKERLLLLRSNVDYINCNDDTPVEELRAKLKIKTLGKNIYAISRVLSEVEWRATIKVLKESSGLSLTQFGVDDTLNLVWWFLPDDPCLYLHGRSFVFRERKNNEVIEEREKYDEFCTREVLKCEWEAVSCAMEAVKDPSATLEQEPSEDLPQQGALGTNTEGMSALVNGYSVFDAEEDVRDIFNRELTSTGYFEFLVEDKLSKSFEKKFISTVELDAEALQVSRNRKRDDKPQKIYCSDSDTESYISSHHSSETAALTHGDKNASSQSIQNLTSPEAKLKTVLEVANEISADSKGVEMEFIRPRMCFAALDEYISRFDLFVETCLYQIKEEMTIVLNFEDESHVFYCLVVAVLCRGYEAANAGTLTDGSQLSNTGNSLSKFENQRKPQNIRRLRFLDDVYEMLHNAMMQNGVDVEDCISCVTSILSEYDSYNLLEIISSEIEKAETEPDSKKCRDHVISAIRFTEKYVWLLLLQVYLSLPFTKDSLSKTAINPTPSFSSFFKSISIRKWLETIDPWKYRPHESPDVYHLRYSNSLRRWDSDNYICFGAIVEQDLE